MLLCLPLLARIAGLELALRPNAAWLALGMLAQGGLAEEVLFRGFMYRHLRRSRTFWRAATLSAVPFTAAHVPLLWSLEPAVAVLALAMAIAWSFPLAWLFDRANGSIWPGAILHGVMQGAIKVLVDDDVAPSRHSRSRGSRSGSPRRGCSSYCGREISVGPSSVNATDKPHTRDRA